MVALPNSSAQIRDYVAQLQAIYGLPSQAGFGSAVFYESVVQAEELEATALKTYRYFVGDLWERWGEAAWRTPWQVVYQRPSDAPRQIVAEMNEIADSHVAASASMLLTSPDDLKAAQTTLSETYDAATVTELVMYAIGDGSALSGLLVAGRRENGNVTLLIFLYYWDLDRFQAQTKPKAAL